MLHVLRRLVPVLALAAATGVQADVVKLTDFTIAGPSGLNVSASHIGASWYGAAGQFSGLLNGNSFVTYCVEMPQYADFGVSYDHYRQVDGVTAFGAEKAEDLSRLISYVGMAPQWSTDSAMVQAAIWEVVHETGRNYSFTSGDVLASGLDSSTQDWLNAFDWAAMKATNPTWNIAALTSAQHQDLLVAQPIPEPGTYALMALGLGLVAYTARRRNAKP
jgi:PEP-CTERM motif